ncbi:putative N(4)-(beta-N-acetylglucosaminyl)-L-asparaginase [Dirofilaria immitis]
MNCKTAIVDFTELFCRAMNEAIDSLGLTGAACYSLEQFPDALIVRVGWCIVRLHWRLGSLEIAKEIYGTEKELEGVPEAEIIGKRL